MTVRASSEIKIGDKVYTINDPDGNEYRIVTLLVEANK